MGDILSTEAEELRSILRPITFICLDDDGNVCFVSESFRKFVEQRLISLKDETNELLINHLQKNPESNEAMTYLPDYLEQARKYEDILEYLSPEHFKEVLKSSQSLSLVQQKAELGINTALKLHKDSDLAKYCIQKSILKEFGDINVLRSEIEALIALNNLDEAIALAQSTIFKEERLQLLALIAKKQKEILEKPNLELVDQIRHLYSQIDHSLFSENSIEVAQDLLFSVPDLAIDLIEKTTSTGLEENSLDWAYAQLSFAALSSKEGIDNIENINAHIKDPKILNFSKSASLLFWNYSSVELIREIEKIEDASMRLYLLSQWLVANKEKEYSADIVEYSIKFAIRTTAYAPNARILRKLSTPLPFINDLGRAKSLVGLFDSQKTAIEKLGPTIDYIRLELILAETESKYNFESASNRTIDIYFYINGLQNLEIRTDCMAWLTASLNNIDPNNVLDRKENIHYLLEEELKSNLQQLLSETAYHYQVIENVTKALAKNKFDLVFNLAKNLNTEERRDLAHSKLIECIIRQPLNEIPWENVIKALNEINNNAILCDAITTIFDYIHENDQHQYLEETIKNTMPIICKIDLIFNSELRCKAYCLAFSLVLKIDLKELEGLKQNLLSKLKASWNSIDRSWRMVDVGFNITRLLADNKDIASDFMKQTKGIIEKNSIYNDTAVSTFFAAILLVIRTYSGLFPKSIDQEDDFNRIKKLIDFIPSSGERARLWSELALRLFISSRKEDSTKVVNEYIKPLIQDISSNDTEYKNQVIKFVSPALYVTHRLTAFDYIDKLPDPDRDEAYFKVCEFILFKKPLFDPDINQDNSKFNNVTHDDIIDICEILNKIEHDALIYHVFCLISTIMSNRVVANTI